MNKKLLLDELIKDEKKVNKILYSSGPYWQYANKRAIPFVIIIAEQEKASQTISIKNLDTGAQEALSLTQVIQTIQS